MNYAAYSAPATIANFGPGFDVIGGAQTEPQGDIVEARRNNSLRGVKLIKIVNDSGLSKLDLPLGPENVVEAVGQKIFNAANEEDGIELNLFKRMKIGTGLGSSASSSVAAALAVNELLQRPYNKSDRQILEAIIHGEAIATKGLGHADNVFPALLGGFVFIENQTTYSHKRFEGRNNLYFAITSPDLVVNTGDARRALKSAPYDIGGLVTFTAFLLKEYLSTGNFANLSGIDLQKLVKEGGNAQKVFEYLKGAHLVMEGIIKNDPQALGIGATMDGIVTPVRAEFIKGYYDVRNAALGAGAYGFTIAGSGPSVVAITDKEDKSHNIGDAMRNAFERNGVKAKIYVSKVNNNGAVKIT